MIDSFALALPGIPFIYKSRHTYILQVYMYVANVSQCPGTRVVRVCVW
jgi:hypothetical protein